MSDPTPVVASAAKTLASFLSDLAGQGLRDLKGSVEVSSGGVITISLAPAGNPGNAFVATVKDNTFTGA